MRRLGFTAKPSDMGEIGAEDGTLTKGNAGRGGETNRIGAEAGIGSAGIENAVVGNLTDEGVLGESVVEDAVAGAHHGGLFAE